MANKSTVKGLIRIEPVEYQFKMGPHRNPRILRYRNLVKCFPIKLSELKEKIGNKKINKKLELEQYSPGYVSYQYKGKPQIILNLKTVKTFVTKETLAKYGERDCQQQSSILLRFLREFLYINFIQKSNTLNPERIGKTAEDREITFRAFKYLMNDPID